MKKANTRGFQSLATGIKEKIFSRKDRPGYQKIVTLMKNEIMKIVKPENLL